MPLRSERQDVLVTRTREFREAEVLRQPVLGEMLRCQICGKDWKHADQEWIEFFNQLGDAEKKILYDKEKDVFLGYDGCEGGEKKEDTGLREDQRSYIRGTSYRPW